ncbi:hypothetical protein D3C76_1075080 [compost metagenome]
MPAIRRAVVRQQLHLGVAELGLRRPGRGDHGHGPVQVPAGVPAGGRHPAQPRHLAGGVGAHPGLQPLGGVLQGHFAAAVAVDARRRAADRPAHAGGIRRPVDPWLADVHHGDLSAVRAGVQQRQRRHAIGGVAGAVPGDADLGAARTRQGAACADWPGRCASCAAGEVAWLDAAGAGVLPGSGDSRQRDSPGHARLLAERRLVGGVPGG